MRVIESKIVVCCPQLATGGPELLHQLVDELRRNGRDAVICYYPFGKKFECPQPYKHYNAPQGVLEDNKDTFIIVPETATWIIKAVHKARVGVWWLSVDNYFSVNRQSKLEDFYLRYKSLLRKRLPLFRLRHAIHFTQSYYAADFLRRASIKSYPLTDYLGPDHLANPFKKGPEDKEDIVVYNPKKGQRQTVALLTAYPNIKFVPIKDMTPAQVATLLRRAKVYVDFGHHPGKDRPPREAALAGCCIITGKQGSAKYQQDVPIPEEYKLDDQGDGYIKSFEPLVKSIFRNFDAHISDFSQYREKIAKEPEIFRQQVKEIFG